MRCFSCNEALTDEESTKKSQLTGEYLDLCNSCFNEVSDIFEEIATEQERKEYELQQISKT